MGARCACLLFLCSILVPAVLPARADVALYTGEVAVASEASERELVVSALNQVLVRLTGRVEEDLVAALEISPAAAENLVLGRQFRRVEVPREGRWVPERRLRVEFDRRGVDGLIDRAGLARWGSERPAVLLWLAEDSGTGVEFMAGDRELEFTLAEASFRYGLPLLRPLLDARDLTEVRPADIRGGFVDAALPAARRYGADVVVMAELRDFGEYWTGRWAWRFADREQAFERSAMSRSEALERGIARIAGALAARLAAAAADRPQLRRVRVGGISRAVQYAELLEYLSGLSRVESVRVAAAEADFVEFELTVVAGELEDVFAFQDLLVFERRDLPSGTLHYRLAW